jgi:hypothetical protein
MAHPIGGRRGDQRAISGDDQARHAGAVDLSAVEAPVSELLPETYRRVLDRIADLEAAGHRLEADLLRRDAIAAYSARWNERAARRLVRLAARAERVLDGHDRPRRTDSRGRAGLARWLPLGTPRARRIGAGTGPAPQPRAGAMTEERPTA